ncbi:hypothetical protein BX600DRAFT_469008 [Xylariales sp. PMI_506]|nr:hypothetical protein BX600DRAFT_469008 [Xylariales sp. PMI_506]
MAALLPLVPLLISLASALPAVTPVFVGAGTCSYYPNFVGSGGSHLDQTGGLFLHPSQTDNSTIDGLYTSREWQNSTIVDVTPNLQVAKEVFECTNGLVHSLYSTTGPLYVDATTGELGEFGSGLALESYQHQVDGATQAGIFLGSGGVTAWAYLYVPGDPYRAGVVDQITLRLLDSQDGVLNDGEFYGFLQVVAA